MSVTIDPLAIVEALPTAALLFVDGTLVAANAAAGRLLAVTPAEIGTPLRHLRLARRVPGLGEAVVAAARGLAVAALSVRSLATPAGLRRVQLTARPVGTSSAVAAVLVIAEDTGAEHEPAGLREEPESRFLVTIAHELRGPLHAILQALHLIGGRSDDRLVRRACTIAGRQVRLQARILDDLFDLTRVRAGTPGLRPERVDLNDVVHDAVESVRLAIEARGQQLGVASAEAHLAVRGDRTRLEQVVRNLLDNARKYTPAGGRIAVWTGTEQATAVIRVSDSGEGLDVDALTRIFEPFTQVATSAAGSRGGLGLGLSLVRSLVEQHGGTVAATSAGRGHGSEFEIRLPLDTAPAPPRSAEPFASSPVARRRILVIEDDLDAREILRLMLELDGHAVEATGGGGEGVRMASASAPDVVLVDLGLPEMDGYEVARRIRRRLGGAVRLVALTGYGGADTAHRVRDAGFDAHVVKPAGPEEIAAALSA